MIDESTTIEKFLVFDTNILYKIIEAINEDEELYGLWLDDLQKYLNHKRYNLYVSEDIMGELSSIKKIKFLDKLFQEKRLSEPRFNYFS